MVSMMQLLEDDNRNRMTKKILILGPPKAGKTTLATFLGEYMGDEINNDDDSGGGGGGGGGESDENQERSRKLELDFTDVYRPTKGVRIVEFESHEFFSKDEKTNEAVGRIMDVEIQLWDVSGDQKYSDCWPAIKEGVNGVIFVANPEEHSGSDLVLWYQEFVEKENLSSDNVMVLLNEQGPKKTNHELVSAFKIEPQLRGVNHVACHFGSEGLSLKNEVNNFLVKIMLQNDSRPTIIDNTNQSINDDPIIDDDDDNLEDDF